jgi:hypothetical protein
VSWLPSKDNPPSKVGMVWALVSSLGGLALAVYLWQTQWGHDNHDFVMLLALLSLTDLVVEWIVWMLWWK